MILNKHIKKEREVYNLSTNKKSNEEIIEFLDILKRVVKKGENVIFNLISKNGKANKTSIYMAETNISKKDILEALLELEVGDFCYAQDDRNVYIGGEFWFFTRDYCLVDQVESMYIKLKLVDQEDEKMLVMSFHPQQPASEDDYLVPLRCK